MPLRYPFFVALCLLTLSVKAQDIETTLTNFNSYHRQTPLEKAYLHTDKEVYVQNETLWFSAYLVNGSTHQPSTLSRLLYVDLIGPDKKTLSSLAVKIEEGKGAGEFFLADSLAEGSYTLMAYTNYMRNFDADFFFAKPVKLVKFTTDSLPTAAADSLPKIDLQLFPEGGYLLAGKPNKVAFKATNKKGYGVNLTANLVTSTGDFISEIKTRHLGMGVFMLTPAAGTSYRIEFEFAGQPYAVPLPPVKAAGYQLTLRVNTAKIYLTASGSPGMLFDDTFVLAHVRGQVVAVLKAAPGKPYIYHEFNQAELPAGIIHFTFFKAGKPLLERLAYVENKHSTTPVETTLLNASLSPRELAEFKFSVAADTLPLSGNLSVSVLKSSDPANRVDIENFLLLTSDLKGSIESPEYYFTPANPGRKQALDLLMLTHGWRRFSWPDILADSLPPITYYPEKGFSIEGQVVDYHNRDKSRPTQVTLSFLENITFQLKAETEADGSFWFDELDIADTVTAVLRTVVETPKKSQRKKARRQGLDEEIRDKGTYIKITEHPYPDPVTKVLDIYTPKEEFSRQLSDREEIELIAAEFDERTIIMEGIEVTGKRDRRSEPYYRERTVMPYANPDSRVILDSINGPDQYIDVFSMVQRVFPSVRVTINSNGLKQFVLRGDVLKVYLDGIELITPGQLYAINPATVEFLDLMRGLSPIDNKQYPPPRSLYIFTRKGGVKSDPKSFQLVKMYGYHQPAEFYVPRYDIMTKKEKLKPDYRTTQYWNPNIELNDGKASVSYYTSDNKGDFVLYIEGLTTSGKILKSRFNFTVE